MEKGGVSVLPIVLAVLSVFFLIAGLQGDWVIVTCTAIVVGISVLIAVWMAKSFKSAWIVVTVSFLVLNAIARSYVLPPIYDRLQLRNAISAGLQKVEFFHLLLEDRPHIVSQITQLVVEHESQGASREEALTRALERVYDDSIRHYSLRASDDTVIAYAASTATLLERLEEIDPELCRNHLLPEDQQVDSSDYVSAEITEQFISLVADIIKSAINDPQPLPDEELAASLTDVVMDKVASDIGSEDIALDPVDPSTDPLKVCSAYRSIYAHTLELPEEQAGLVIRSNSFFFSIQGEKRHLMKFYAN